MSRREQILALLDSRHDHLPEPVRRHHTRPGFVHRTLAPAVCPTCDGLDRHCPECRGRGEIEVLRQRDPYATEQATHWVAATPKLADGDRERNAELARLEQQLAVPVSEADVLARLNEHTPLWERERRAMYDRYDYHALDDALVRLAYLDIHPHSQRGLELLDRWLPDPLRAPARIERLVVNAAAKGRQADPRARQQRDDAILELVAAGMAYGHIAATVGLTVRQLRRIVNRDTEQAA